jgi:hypothetical protein
LPKFSPLNRLQQLVAGKAWTPPRTTSSRLVMRPSFQVAGHLGDLGGLAVAGGVVEHHHALHARAVDQQRR